MFKVNKTMPKRRKDNFDEYIERKLKKLKRKFRKKLEKNTTGMYLPNGR